MRENKQLLRLSIESTNILLKRCTKLPDKKLHRRTLLDGDIIVVGLRRLCPVVFGTEPEAHLVLVGAAAVQLLDLVGYWGSHLDVLQ